MKVRLQKQGEDVKTHPATRWATDDGCGGASAVTGKRKERKAEPQLPPATPTTWMSKLESVAKRPLECEGRTEDHRQYWFHPSSVNFPLGKIEPFTDRGPEDTVNRVTNLGIATKDKAWGSLNSDYGQAQKQVGQYHQLRRTRSLGANTINPMTPRIFITELKKKRLNPSMVSAGVQSTTTGGTHICLKHTLSSDKLALLGAEKRQIGEYEAMYEQKRATWGDRRPGSAGLCTSDVTQFADEANKMKALGGRGAKSDFVLKDPKTKLPCPQFKT